MNNIFQFSEFDFGCQIGFSFYDGKYTICFNLPSGVRLNHTGALMRLLDFVAFVVNHAPQKEKDEYFLQSYFLNHPPIFDQIGTTKECDHLWTSEIITQEIYQCPLGFYCLLNRNQKDVA